MLHKERIKYIKQSGGGGASSTRHPLAYKTQIYAFKTLEALYDSYT